MGDSTADFLVRLVGSDVKPWKVPMRTLARVLDAVQRLVEQTEDETESGGSTAQDTIPPGDPEENQIGISGSQALRLIGVRSASAGYAISTPLRSATIGVLASTGRAIEDPTNFDWSGPTISSIKTLSDVAASLDVKIEIRKPRKGSRNGDVIAKITPQTYEDISESAFVRGNTSLYGTIERIGGTSEARCAFRLPDQTKLIYCGVADDELARKLGKHLYESVSIHGEATWLRSSWQIRHFKIREFDEPKAGSIRDAMREIWAAGGKAWDKIKDPGEYIKKEMRGA
jgi:hypothetical protein